MPHISSIIESTIEIDQTDVKDYLAKIKMAEEIKIVYFGTAQFSALVLEDLISSTETTPLKFTIQTVITQPDRPVGRDQKITPSPVSTVADRYHIQILKPEKLTQEWISENRATIECDLFIVAAYGQILPIELLNIPSKGAINIHGSILPQSIV